MYVSVTKVGHGYPRLPLRGAAVTMETAQVALKSISSYQMQSIRS